MSKFIKGWNGYNIMPEDMKFYVDKPSPNFSAEKNKAVIAQSIKKAQAKRAQAWKEWEKPARERTDAVASYLNHLNQGHTTQLEKYFGRQYMSYFRGQQLLSKVKTLANGQKAYQLYE